MNDHTIPDAPPPAKKAAKKAATPTAESSAPAADTRTAKIRTLRPRVKAKGFTLGAKQVVEGVPLAHAEYLAGRGEAEILEVI